MLVLKLDSGLKDLDHDLDTSVGQAIDEVSQVVSAVAKVLEDEGISPVSRTSLRAVLRHLERTIVHLQVGDRGQQKVEALRALLQELTDRLYQAPDTEVDLAVNTQRFDRSILSATEGVEEATDISADDEEMSQDDIDALFG